MSTYIKDDEGLRNDPARACDAATTDIAPAAADDDFFRSLQDDEAHGVISCPGDDDPYEPGIYPGDLEYFLSSISEDELFAHFWFNYPREANETGARIAFANAIKKVPARQLIIAAYNYKDWCRISYRKPEEQRFIKYASNWLNDERWNDESCRAPVHEISNIDPVYDALNKFYKSQGRVSPYIHVPSSYVQQDNVWKDDYNNNKKIGNSINSNDNIPVSNPYDIEAGLREYF